jgi:uncharacterized membrane protein
MRRGSLHPKRGRASLRACAVFAVLAGCRTDAPTAVPSADLTMQPASRLEVTATWLGTLPVNGRIIRANAINDRGEIVGQGYRGMPDVRYLAVRWTEAEQAQPIDATASYHASEAIDVNDGGDVIGWVSAGLGAPGMSFVLRRRDVPLVLDQGPYPRLTAINKRAEAAGNAGQALVWSESGGITWLPGPRANDINDRGDVAGIVVQGTAGVFRADGSVIALVTPVPDESEATGINDRGDVVGIVGIRHYSRAFVWSERDGIRLLDTPAGWYSVAEAINDRGDVAGWIAQGGTSGPTIAVMWTAKGELVQLGSTPGAGPVASLYSRALDLNNRGEVVGYVDEARPGGTDGYRWTVRVVPAP